MYLGKDVRILLKGSAKDSFLELKKRQDKEAQILIKSVERIILILKDNPLYGDPINKTLIPEVFRKEGIKNLYRVELSNYWRMIYTIEGSNVEIFLFVLSLVDHKKYNKMFGYK
ncbi:MAG: hypothetical protein AABW48_03490 [Nanoarchaeota archaeon]